MRDFSHLIAAGEYYLNHCTASVYLRNFPVEALALNSFGEYFEYELLDLELDCLPVFYKIGDISFCVLAHLCACGEYCDAHPRLARECIRAE